MESNTTSNFSSRQTILSLAAISLFVLPIIFLYPFHADIDIMQVLGFQFARYHELPYIGHWDGIFPILPFGPVFIHAASILLFGNSEFSLRLMDVIFQIGSIIVLYRIGRFWLDRAPALLGSALYALFYVLGPGQYISQRDCFAVLPILVCIWLTVAAFRAETNRRRAMLLVGAGIMGGLATWIRPTFGLLLAAPFVSLFDLRRAASWRALAFESLGFALVIALGLLPYALTPGGLSTFYLVTIRFNLEVYSHALTLSSYSRRVWVVVCFIAIWGLSILNHKRKETVSRYKPKVPEETRYMVAVILALLAGVVIMRRLASYHFAPFFACFMPILAAVVWEAFDRHVRRRSWRIALIALALAAMYPWHFALHSLSSAGYSIPRAVRRVESGNGVSQEVASYVEHCTRPSDRVELASITSPGPRWRIDRPFATPFTTILTLITQLPNGSYTPYQQVWQKEYVDSMRIERPQYYIVDNPAVPKSQPTTLDLLYTLPGLKSLIQTSYRLDTAIGNYMIYRRVP
ncbi:MAG TPA: glycosyltransferase family 39 protein [Candidatus Kapabacteria bacterium]|nr:glycosyltransferase family 39 protein [Candidatus Kapabacteria bacterium]